MSFHVLRPYVFDSQAQVWELMPSGQMAMLVATFVHEEDAHFFASLKNGIAQSKAGQTVSLGTFAHYAEDDDVPEVGPEEFVLVDDEGFVDESEYEYIEPYSLDTTPTNGPLAPEHGDFL